MFNNTLNFFNSNKDKIEWTFVSMPILDKKDPLGKDLDLIRLFVDGSYFIMGLDYDIHEVLQDEVVVKIPRKINTNGIDVLRFTKKGNEPMSVSHHPHKIIEKVSIPLI